MRNPLLVWDRPVQITTRIEDAVQSTVRSKVLKELLRVCDSQTERPEPWGRIKNIFVAG
jgi:hypothetical protein